MIKSNIMCLKQGDVFMCVDSDCVDCFTKGSIYEVIVEAYFDGEEMSIETFNDYGNIHLISEEWFDEHFISFK